MTHSIRTAAAGAAGALVVAIAALSVHAGPSVAAPTASPSDPATHTISVSASGTVTIVPDVARITLGVTFNRPTVKAARSDAATAMTHIIAAVKKLGIADADIQTVGINLNPQYNNSGRVTGYTISEQLRVTVRDLDKAGDVIDEATAQGATDANGISFELADPAKAMNDARAAAVTAAQASAQAMASAGHVTLGPVVSISDASPVTPINYGLGSMGALGGAVPSTPVQVGTQDVTLTVIVVFAIG
jgi:uncharacterized protein